MKTKAWIFDIDGTVHIGGDRGVFDIESCVVDKRCETAHTLYHALEPLFPIIFCTGRDEEHREVTEAWLARNGFGGYTELFMRPRGDTRPDQDVKEEIYKTHIEPKYEIIGCIDDRNRVVERYREMGLTVLQIRPGDF